MKQKADKIIERHDAPDICDGALAIGIRHDLCRTTLRPDRLLTNKRKGSGLEDHNPLQQIRRWIEAGDSSAIERLRSLVGKDLSSRCQPTAVMRHCGSLQAGTKRVAHPLSLGDESRGITANGHAMRPNHRKQGKRGSRSRTNLPDLTGTFKQALVFHRTGRLVDAERLYRSLHLLGVVYSQRDKHAEAVRKDPNVWGMKRVGIALNSGSGRGSESFLAASGMSIGRGESAGNFPRG
jgi:hypothetical protein